MGRPGGRRTATGPIEGGHDGGGAHPPPVEDPGADPPEEAGVAADLARGEARGVGRSRTTGQKGGDAMSTGAGRDGVAGRRHGHRRVKAQRDGAVVSWRTAWSGRVGGRGGLGPPAVEETGADLPEEVGAAELSHRWRIPSG